MSEHWFALIHTPIPISEAMQNADAKKALNKEWDKLDDLKAFRKHQVRSKAEVQKEAKDQGRTVHFGELMELCHEKHSELPIHLRSYKGRVVFRGDQTKDESGFYAVLSEQGTSASHLAAAKFLDAICRFPGCDGENADASSAYTQVRFADLQTDSTCLRRG